MDFQKFEEFYAAASGYLAFLSPDKSVNNSVRLPRTKESLVFAVSDCVERLKLERVRQAAAEIPPDKAIELAQEVKSNREEDNRPKHL